MIRLIDIGGSGVKTATLSDNFRSEDLNSIVVTHFQNPDWSDFVKWAYKNGLFNCHYIGISSAGFIKNDIVKLFRVGNWHDKNILKEINEFAREIESINEQHDNKVFQRSEEYNFIKPHVHLLNDAEAHLAAHTDLFYNPIMSISLGTSLGFALSDKNGIIVRALNDFNFDIGQMSIPTSASKKEVWWALGSNGLNELQKNLGQEKGNQRFGYRLGALLVTLCSIFRPKTVVFSGGITENHWNVFKEPMQAEFYKTKPDWLDQTDLVKSPYCINAALVGMAKFLKMNMNK